MSPTTDDLRRRMEAELDDFASLPDLTEAALSGGRQRRRHRRLTAVAGTVLASLAVVPVLVLGTPHAPDESALRPTDVATDPTPAVDAQDAARQRAADVRAAAEADGVVTDAEWDASVVATLDAILPTRFRGVDQTENDAVTQVRTRAGSPPLDLWLAVSGNSVRVEVQPGWGGCTELRRAAASVDFQFDVLDCADARLANGLRAQAELEHVINGAESDSPGSETYGGSLIILGDTVYTQLAVGAVDRGTPAAITADELLAMGRSDDYLDLLRIGVAYARDRTYPADSGFGRRVDPVWPG